MRHNSYYHTVMIFVYTLDARHIIIIIIIIIIIWCNIEQEDDDDD